MTGDQAHELLRKIVQAKNQAELQQLLSDHIQWCDGVFFAELEAMVAQFRAKGDQASAHKLQELGDYMARLRFMI
jgi:hypothetical protein